MPGFAELDRLTPSKDIPLTPKGLAELEARTIECHTLRAAALRVCWFDWSSNDADAVAAIDDLRKLVK